MSDAYDVVVIGSGAGGDTLLHHLAPGVGTAGIAELLARNTGTSPGPAGHAEVNPDLTAPGHPEISVIGDAAKLAGPDGKPLPGLATVAIQQARQVAQAIRQGEPGASKPVKYFDKGAFRWGAWARRRARSAPTGSPG